MSHPDIIGNYSAPPPARTYRVQNEGRTRAISEERRRSSDDAIRRLFLKSDLPIARPTMLRPGSAAKVELMQLRYEAGLPVQHPDDAKNGVGLFNDPEDPDEDDPEFDEPERDEDSDE